MSRWSLEPSFEVSPSAMDRHLRMRSRVGGIGLFCSPALTCPQSPRIAFAMMFFWISFEPP